VLATNLEAVTIRKIRRRILPLLLILYFVAYLDRINLGFAALSMNAALSITSAQFGLLAGIFFCGYFLFEIPSNLLLHKIGARIWIARILITWGVVATLTGAVQNVTQLYVARFALGLAEAGFFPGIILYLTWWFRDRELARVIALFSMALPVSNILGAPLSGVILDHTHWAGVASWRWLLILEGFPAVVCGVLTYFLLPGRPAEAAFLTNAERGWITSELRREEQGKAGDRPNSAWRALTDSMVWRLAISLVGFDIALYAMTFYMPQAIKSMADGHSNTAVGILVMVPHLAGLIGMALISRSSDRKLERRFHTAIPAIGGGIALMLLGTTNSMAPSLVLWSIAAVGLYSFLGPFFALPGGFLTGFSAASGIALINSVGNLGGFIGPSVIGAMAHGPGGIYRGLALAGVALFVSAGLVLLLPRQGPRQGPHQGMIGSGIASPSARGSEAA
jgi:MFS transporter, ACS family, tartrate transporter